MIGMLDRVEEKSEWIRTYQLRMQQVYQAAAVGLDVLYFELRSQRIEVTFVNYLIPIGQLVWLVDSQKFVVLDLHSHYTPIKRLLQWTNSFSTIQKKTNKITLHKFHSDLMFTLQLITLNYLPVIWSVQFIRLAQCDVEICREHK